MPRAYSKNLLHSFGFVRACPWTSTVLRRSIEGVLLQGEIRAMPRLAVPLTDARVRNAKSRAKNYKLCDGNGLYLAVSSVGTKRWHLKYKFVSVEKQLPLGAYPVVDLKSARTKMNAARELLDNGIDPKIDRKMKMLAEKLRVAASFEVVARECLDKFSLVWSKDYHESISRSLERDIFPHIGSRPIADVTGPELLDALRRVEARGAVDTAHRILDTCGQVLRYGASSGRQVRDFSGDLKEALKIPKGKHLAAATELETVAAILRAIDGLKATFVVQRALRLTPFVFVRPIELRQAQWVDIDLKKALWTFRKSKQREFPRRPFPDDESLIVPLSRQARKILMELQIVTGRGTYVFPGQKRKASYIGINTLSQAMRKVGIKRDESSVHGFRATARTLLSEQLHVQKEIIELQLGHRVADSNGRAYNRTKFLRQRTEMMQQWADYLDSLKVGRKYKQKTRIRI